MVTLPKVSEDGLAVSCPGLMPTPDSGIVRTGAVDEMVMLPLALAEEVGANVTLNVALCPEDSESGVEIPLKVNPVPLTVI